MVRLDLTGPCRTCNVIDLSLNEATVYYGGEARKHYQLQCTHAPVCYLLVTEPKNSEPNQEA